MEQYLPYLVVLACPVGMGLMMWFMMRGQRGAAPSPDQAAEIARLRAEIASLRQPPQDQYDFRDPANTQH
jgi:hypothetical protein